MIKFKNFNKRNKLTEIKIRDTSTNADPNYFDDYLDAVAANAARKKGDSLVKKPPPAPPGGVTQIDKSGKRTDYLVNQPPPDPETITPPKKVVGGYDAAVEKKREQTPDKRVRDVTQDAMRPDTASAVTKAQVDVTGMKVERDRKERERVAALTLSPRKTRTDDSEKTAKIEVDTEKRKALATKKATNDLNVPKTPDSTPEPASKPRVTNIDNLSFGKAFAQEFAKKPGGVMTWKGKQYKLVRK